MTGKIAPIINDGINTPWIDNHHARDMGEWTPISTFWDGEFAKGDEPWACLRKAWHMRPDWTGAMSAELSVESTIRPSPYWSNCAGP